LLVLNARGNFGVTFVFPVKPSGYLILLRGACDMGEFSFQPSTHWNVL